MADPDLKMKDCHLTGCEHPSVRLGPELLIQSMTTSFHPGRGTKESFGGPEREGGFSSKGEEVTSGNWFSLGGNASCVCFILEAGTMAPFRR